MPRIVNLRPAEYVPNRKHPAMIEQSVPRDLWMAPLAAPLRKRVILALRDASGEIGALHMKIDEAVGLASDLLIAVQQARA